MKKSLKSSAGVTLLEIMLVLAVAAMVIVMSIRYYRGASNNRAANDTIEQIQAIATAMDSLAQASNSYAGITISQIAPMVMGNSSASSITNAFGGAVTLGALSPSTYVINELGIPSDVCTIITAQLKSNTKITMGPSCSNYTYNSQG